MTPDELKRAGRKLFGDRWQTAMARRLGKDPSTVRRWASGNVPVPKLAEEAMKLLLKESVDAIDTSPEPVEDSRESRHVHG